MHQRAHTHTHPHTHAHTRTPPPGSSHVAAREPSRRLQCATTHVCACVCVCVCVCVSLLVHACACVWPSVHVCICACVHVCDLSQCWWYAPTHIHTYTHTRIHAHRYTDVQEPMMQASIDAARGDDTPASASASASAPASASPTAPTLVLSHKISSRMHSHTRTLANTPPPSYIFTRADPHILRCTGASTANVQPTLAHAHLNTDEH